MQVIILIIHILSALTLIALVLLQHGKGADIGATFGSGSAQTVFGARGSIPFLMKITAILAAIFFSTSIALGYISTHAPQQPDLMKFPGSSPNQSYNIPATQPVDLKGEK